MSHRAVPGLPPPFRPPSFPFHSLRYPLQNAMASLPTSSAAQATASPRPSQARRTPKRRKAEHSDVLVSAVISTYHLTHLHHVLQRAEYGAQQDGNAVLAANYAQLRKVLCLDARSMEDASACGSDDLDNSKAAAA